MDWDDWQKVLAEAFRRGPGQPVFLYVDDEFLTDLAGQNGAQSLGSVVRGALSYGSDPYRNILLSSSKAKLNHRGEPPPTLPLLALTVLAATRMERTKGVSQTAYYRRLWEAAGVPPDGALAESMKTEFDTVAVLWQQFHNWLSDAGKDFGVSTIRLSDPRFTRIGYPLSQALLRRADRNVLTRLWAALGQQFSADSSGEELVQHLKRWMRTSRGLSKQFVDTVAGLTEKTLPAFGEALRDAAQDWDGVVLSKSGHQMHEAELAVQPTLAKDWKAVWIIQRDSGAVSVPLKASDMIESPVVYAADGQEWTGLNDGLAVLSWDSLRGSWTNTERMFPGATHALVWHPHLSDAVKLFVGRSQKAGSLRLKKLTSDGVCFLEDVRFLTDKEISDALRLAGLTGIKVVGAASPRLSLSFGLRVTNALHSAIYIHGGEPDLAVPPGDGDRLAVRLDNGPNKELPRGVLTPLRNLAAELPAGAHKIESTDGSVEFETIIPGDVVVEPGVRVACVAFPEMSIKNESCSDSYGERLVIAKRRRDETWLIGRAGHIRAVVEPPPPSYWDRLLADEADPLHFVVVRQRCEGWIIQRKRDEYYVDQLIGAADELEIDDSAPDNDAWLRLLTAAASACDSHEWLQLLSVAGVK